MNKKHALGILGADKFYHDLWWKAQRKENVIPKQSYELETIFVHIPKTAGTSVFRALDIVPCSDTHAPISAYRWHDPGLHKRAFKFSIVRNPWDRFVSSFFFLRDYTTWDIQKKWAAEYIRGEHFNEFVKKMLSSRYLMSAVKSERFFWPQCYWLDGGVDKVYSFENLNDGIVDISKKLGICGPNEMPHERKGARKNYREMYDDTSLNLVADLYADDVREFGYEF